ncbi:FxsA family protein [Kribbella sp. NPDC006257]|uniref:FxsA family protein n=1 Tax=Kribbella sp. NPDC006257 TaxID=3156738 RepID=UPI0033BC6EB8
MPWFIAAALLLVPIIEIYVIIQVGQVIGGWPTVGLLLVESALGAWIIKREGRRAWNALQTALKTGRMPGRELADAALILVGGTLLLTPGFVTDLFGFFFVLPFTRPLARKLLTGFVSRRVVTQLGDNPLTGFIPGSFQQPPRQTSGDVIQGEVIDPDRPHDKPPTT